MCIIAYKPKGIELPFDWEDIVEHCFKRNDDGAGLMFRMNRKTHIYKGYMDVKPFINAIKFLFRENDMKEIPFAMHFRIKTSGAVDQHMCHPFPASKDDANIKSLMGVVPVAIMHNGVFSQFPSEGDLSDTAMFAKTLGGFSVEQLERPSTCTLMNAAVSYNRVLMFTPRSTQMYGDWETKYGMHFSGKDFEPWVTGGNYQTFGHSNRSSHRYTTYSKCFWCEQMRAYCAVREGMTLCMTCIAELFSRKTKCSVCNSYQGMYYLTPLGDEADPDLEYICEDCVVEQTIADEETKVYTKEDLKKAEKD